MKFPVSAKERGSDGMLRLVGADGAHIACIVHDEDAQRIVASINAMAGMRVDSFTPGLGVTWKPGPQPCNQIEANKEAAMARAERESKK